ncbi:hypothetical protein [Metapseudomonas boanensis]|uniref:Uncharacterized protein n=1 Tax=Metapseudomonas boanensis TaxID=2822138 RepID=A0ABS5XQF6_9GAMM|nr:hypothetical protein [Pseudomonas boanensis]MBT8768527.1 hypothetical protein [Pseudomonas boanensis]
MTAPSLPRRRLHINALELDLRGIPAETAEAAARLLGPALAQALAGQDPQALSGERLDAGQLAGPAAPSAQALAAGIAQRIASTLRGEQP